MNEQKSMMVNVESSFSEIMDMIINLLQNQTPQQLPFSFVGASQGIPTQAPSPFATPLQNAPRQVVLSSFATPMGSSSTAAAADTGYHHIRDLKNVKPIALGKIEEMGPGKTMDNRPMGGPEAKVRVICVYPGMRMSRCIWESRGPPIIWGSVPARVVWPIYLLEKIA